MFLSLRLSLLICYFCVLTKGSDIENENGREEIYEIRVCPKKVLVKRINNVTHIDIKMQI